LRGFVVGTIVTAIAFFVLAELIPQYTKLDFVTYDGDFIGILVISVVFGLVNGLVGTIVRILALPIRMMTLGLIGFVINAAMLLLTAVILSACRRTPSRSVTTRRTWSARTRSSPRSSARSS